MDNTGHDIGKIGDIGHGIGDIGDIAYDIGDIGRDIGDIGDIGHDIGDIGDIDIFQEPVHFPGVRNCRFWPNGFEFWLEIF